MPRKKKQQIKINSGDSLEGLLQEVYNDACKQINDAQRTINELSSSVTPQDVDDATKIAKEKTNAQKVKDSGVKIKLEVAKVQANLYKNSGDVAGTVKEMTGHSNLEQGFKAVRQMIKDSAKDNDNSEE